MVKEGRDLMDDAGRRVSALTQVSSPVWWISEAQDEPLFLNKYKLARLHRKFSTGRLKSTKNAQISKKWKHILRDKWRSRTAKRLPSVALFSLCGYSTCLWFGILHCASDFILRRKRSNNTVTVTIALYAGSRVPTASDSAPRAPWEGISFWKSSHIHSGACLCAAKISSELHQRFTLKWLIMVITCIKKKQMSRLGQCFCAKFFLPDWICTH